MTPDEMSAEQVLLTLIRQLEMASVSELIDALFMTQNAKMSEQLRQRLVRMMTIKLSLKVLKDDYVTTS